MGKSVLVVDDEADIREALRIILEADGYQVLEAGDGLEALQMVQRARPDLVILDIMMPRMDGLEVLRRLEADPETAGLPVIFLSVLTSEMDVIHGLEQGAVEYITKPFDPFQVARTVHMMLEELDREGRHRYRQQLIERRRRGFTPLHWLFHPPED
ncbi:MAG: response regulator [Anaerolineae bacterium]